MRIRKVLLASLLAIGVLWAGGPAIGAPPEGKGGGPACADIVSLSGSYSPPEGSGKDPEDAGPAIVSPELTVAAPSCHGKTYTVTVLDDDSTGAPVVATASVRGNGSTVIDFGDISFAEEEDDTTVCVFATSSAGNHTFDRQPAEGCAVVDESPVPLEGGWSP